MKPRTLLALAAVAAAAWFFGVAWGQQRPAAPASQPAAPSRGRGFGRGALRGATAEQLSAITDMNDTLAPDQEALANAETDLLAAVLAWPADPAALQQKLETLDHSQRTCAEARAGILRKIQSSSAKLSDAQLAALANAPAPRRAGPAPRIPHMSSRQVTALTLMTGEIQKALQPQLAARAALAAAVASGDGAALKEKLDALAGAEKTLADARAAALVALQNSPEKLDADQLAALVANNGVLVSGAFDQPLPYDFDDHAGYTSLFDGKTLDGWDGNPKFWRVEDGAIVGESTAQNPSGNTYIACRRPVAKNFTLKCEIKVEGAGGSGIQYRSHTGIPWLTPVPANVIANAGPTNLDWMMTGPQADFWPSRDSSAMYSGQFYSENTPMRIMAWRGQVVEGFGMGPRRLLGTIGDRAQLGKIVKQNDWNQYIVVARGGTFLHIVNGQLMAAMIDDDPDSSNNQPGLVGIEIEATTRVSVRDIWMKQLD